MAKLFVRAFPAVGIVGALVLLSGCAESSGTAAAPSQSASATSVARDGALSGVELASVIVDTTHTGSDKGKPYSEYYAANGKVKGADYSGTWTAKGDKACFTYPPEAEVCYTVTRDPSKASTIIWTTESGEKTTTTFVAGNPKNL